MEVDLDTMAEAQATGALVIDVRNPDEYTAAHVPGVQLLPLDELPNRWEELPTDRRIYVICHSGARSDRAAEALRNAGLDAVNVAGGTKRWIEEGRPVNTGMEP